MFLLFSSVSDTSCYYVNSSYFENDLKTIKYSLIIDNDGGASSQSTLTISKNRVNINTPNKNGYKFIGYSYVKDGITFYTFGRNVLIDTINNQKLNANWQLVTYTIGYTLNGGECEEEMITSYTVLSDPIILCKPFKYGFTFLGWSGSNGNIIQENVTIPTGSYGNKVYAATYQRNI